MFLTAPPGPTEVEDTNKLRRLSDQGVFIRKGMSIIYQADHMSCFVFILAVAYEHNCLSQ